MSQKSSLPQPTRSVSRVLTADTRLQHLPVGSARADGGCARLSALTGRVGVTSCKGSRIAVRHQSRSRSGEHPGTSAATARSAKAEITEIGPCSRCPEDYEAGDAAALAPRWLP